MTYDIKDVPEGFFMRTLHLTEVTVVILALLLWFVPAVASAYPSAYEYRTRETEHFRISYHQGEEGLADYVVVLIEDIHSNLSPILDWKPGQKTEVLLVDHTDSSNGFSNVYPYNRLVLYMAPPGQDNALNDYDDWLRLLISHEYTHILQLDTKSGLVAVVNKIFGKTLNPNQQKPRWYSEGSAIWSESRMGAGGRNRSSFFEMYIRANFLEGRDLDISEWHAERHEWPYGNTVYLYGMKFMQYMADKTGDDTLAALGYLYGQRLIPYSLNTVMKQATDTDWLQLYDEWRAQLKSRYEEDRRRIEKLGLSHFELLTKGGPAHGSPLLHPSGSRMAFYFNDGKNSRNGWYFYDVKNGEKSLIVESDSGGAADFAPDGRRLVYSQAQNYQREYYYYDLFMHDLDRGETRRITTRKRAQEPDFHPDGSRIAYVSMQPGKSRLEILNLDHGGTEQPLPEELFEQVYQPRWSPDGKKLAFVARARFGFKDLYIMDMADNRVTNLSSDNAQDLTPSWSPDGRYLLWSSDRSGIFNIYAFDTRDGEVYQITNVITGAFEPQMNADASSLYFAHYSSDAFDLARMDIDRSRWMKAPAMPELRPKKEYNMKPVEYTDKEYSPFPSIYPKLWHPTWGEDAKGDTVGITTWGDDLTYRHSWQAEFDYGIESRAPTFGASYTTRIFAPSISMRFANTSYTLPEAALVGSKRVDQDESRYSGGISMSFPMAGRENRGRDTWTYSHGVSIGYSYSYTRLLNTYSYSPLENPPVFAENGFMSGLGVSWSYSNREGYPGYVGTSAGRSFYVSVSTQSDALGSDYNNIVASAGYAEFIANPWVDHHVLALKFNGGMGVSNYRERKIFYIGGPPERDIVSDLIRDERVSGSYVRGYRPYALGGDKYLMFNSEYRFVVWHIEKGIYTLPVFFRRLHLAPFFDAANVWSERLEAGETRMGVGGEVRLDMVFGYARPATIRIGYQVGLNEGGIHGFIMALDNLF